jgi:PPOX class probable F420-dependent enzyme
MRQLVEPARVARLATVGVDGRPHLVPVCFALVGDSVYSAVDGKPKRSTNLQRIANVVATSSVCVIVDHYSDDWSQLWWVRLDGTGRVVEDAAETAKALAVLSNKYPQYVDLPPPGPVLAVDVTGWTGWSAAA